MSKSSIFVYEHVSVFLCVWYTHTRIERNICAHSYEYYIDSVVGIIHTTLSMFILKGSTHDVFPHENMRPSNTLYVCGFLYRLGLRCEYGDTARRDAFITWIKLSFEWRTSFLLLLLYIHKYNIICFVFCGKFPTRHQGLYECLLSAVLTPSCANEMLSHIYIHKDNRNMVHIC